MWLSLHVVSWLRAALPPRSSPRPGSLRGHSRASRCPPGSRGHSYLRDRLGQGSLRPLLRPHGGHRVPRGVSRGRSWISGDSGGFEMAVPSLPGSGRAQRCPAAFQDIPSQDRSPWGSRWSPRARAGLGVTFHAVSGVVGAVSKCPRGVVAPKESFPGVLPLFFFCLIRRIHSRVPLPGAVSGVWNKR